MKKAIVSTSQNIFYDGKQVDHNDLTLEQQYNDVRVSSTVQNVVGNGVIVDSLEENLLYKGSGNNQVTLINNVSDTTEGCQILVSLTGSQACGERKVKVLIVGLDFNFNLIYDAISLRNNETIVTKKHYTNILVLHINDISGDPNESMLLGGILEVKEAPSCFLSKNTISDENSNPSIFFRDMYCPGGDPYNYLSGILPGYNLGQLDLQYGQSNFDRVQRLQRGDYTTQLGQKFIAKNNNIQKITLLMSVENVDDPGDLQWDGDLNVSIYPLQSSVSCITDIIPENKIDYPPTATPLAQISLNYFGLLAKGYLLDGDPQPVDFIFSNTSIANGKNIKVGEAYAIVLKRSGSNTQVDLKFSSSENEDTSRQVTIFTGNGWVNVSTESLWYQIHTDSAKVSSGQYYNYGQGLVIEKIKYDAGLGTNIDYSFDGLDFANNSIYKALCESKLLKHKIEENPRTGDNVNSQKKYIPSIRLLSPTEFSAVNSGNNQYENLIVGAIKDTNTKYENTDVFDFNIRSYGAVENRLFIKVITNGADPKFDQSVIDLKSMIITNELKSAKVSTSTGEDFRIADAKIHTIQIGNYKNSTIDYDDLNVFSIYKNLDFNTAPEVGPSSITYNASPPYNIIYNPGYDFLNRTDTGIYNGVNFILTDNEGIELEIAQGNMVIQDPSIPDVFYMSGANIDFEFETIGKINPYVYINDLALPNSLIGRYSIISMSGDSAVIKKAYLKDDYLKALSFDIDGDQIISENDGYLLNIYLNKTPYTPYASPYPTTNPYSKINKTYEVIELTLEKFIDRHDDYFLSGTRGLDIHDSPTIFYNDALFQDYSAPIEVNLVRQLTWISQDVFCSSDPRAVMAVYSDALETKLDNEPNVFPDPLDFQKNINNYYNPGNYLLDGNLLNKDKSFHKLDFEVSDIILEIPEGLDGYEKNIDIFDVFVAEAGTVNPFGLTYKGFPARKFSDGTYVQQDALSKEQVRFSAAIQSFVPELDGEYLGDDAIIVDGRMGLAIADNGILSLNFTNLYNDPAYVTGNTKIKISVFLKKAGFSNKTLSVSSTQVFNLLSG